MKADRSRDTFDPRKHYRRVLHQQGRVVLDADDNEQVSIDLATSERTLSDVIGPAGVPETSLAPGYAGGFALGIGGPAGSSSSSSFGSFGSFSSIASAVGLQSGIGSSSSSSGSSSSEWTALPGNDLTIEHGRIYVDGILVVNDADTTLLTQPYLPLDGNASPTGLAGAGVYAAYLDIWERVVTPIDDPSIQEIALGGPDTCLRSQIVWQVRLGQIDTTQYGTNPACAAIAPPWPQRPNPGQLAALTAAPATDPVPCTLPPESGYQSLENQLYRVEIETAGGYGSATFKWSRENGSVVFGIVPAPGQPATGTVSGTTLYVTSTGRDASLGLSPGDWVELIDDRAEFIDGHGELLQVAATSDAQMTVTLQNAPTQSVDLALHPKLRRWDQSVSALATGIAIVDGTPIDLENGVQVQFSNGQYAVGDYWLIPARTATAQQAIGTIEWPADAAGNPLPQNPRGIVHHYCRLGIVAFDGYMFQPPQGASAITDCRLFFPPLTGLEQNACPCTITLQPGTNWTAQLAALFAQTKTADAEICFAAGEFDTAQTIPIATTGNVKVTGAGWGTRIVGQKLETVLRFQNCASVSVRDLSVSATRTDTPVDATTQHIGGAIEFDDCAEVRVEAVALACTGALTSGAACLTVRNTVTAANAATGAGTVWVSDSRLTVGRMQYGMMFVHVMQAFVKDNELIGNLDKLPGFQISLQNPLYRRLVERVLVGGAGSGAALSSSSASSSSSSSATGAVSPKRLPPDAKKAAAAIKPKTTRAAAKKSASTITAAVAPAAASASAPANAGTEATTATSATSISRTIARLPNTLVSVGATSIAFNTPTQLKGVWQTYVDTAAPKEFATSNDLLAYVKQAATTLLTSPAAQAQFAGFRDIIRFFENNQVAAGRAAIVFGGRGSTDIVVNGNAINGFMQGIVVGVSHRETAPPVRPPDAVGAVSIRDNLIQISIDPVLGHAAARYAIFVGNVGSLLIDNNRATLNVAAQTEIATDGIRVFGYLGKRLIVRHNYLTRFQTGIRVVQVATPGHYNAVTGPQGEVYLQPLRRALLWLVADNVLESVSQPLAAPSCLLIDNVQV